MSHTAFEPSHGSAPPPDKLFLQMTTDSMFWQPAPTVFKFNFARMPNATYLLYVSLFNNFDDMYMQTVFADKRFIFSQHANI